MTLEIKKNTDAFQQVSNSFLNPQEKHLYIHVCKQPGMLEVASRKQEASSFKAVKAYLKQISTSKDMDLESKKEVVHSFEKILEPFAKKKRILHKIFFFIQFFKNRQINDARKFIQKFNSYAQNPSDPALKKYFENGATPTGPKQSNEDTLALLTNKLQKSAAAYIKLRYEDLGSYALWEDPKSKGDYIFFQKTTATLSESDFNDLSLPQGAVKISSDKNFKEEIDRLTSFEARINILKGQGVVFNDYTSAAKALEGPLPYAIFFEQTPGNNTVHFIQKIPGIPLAKNQSILIKAQENPFEAIEKYTSKKEQNQILQKHGKSIQHIRDIENEKKKLQHPGDYFIYNSSSSYEIHFVDVYGKVSSKSLHDDNLFASIDAYLRPIHRTHDIIKKNLTTDEPTARIKLASQEVGSFLYYPHTGTIGGGDFDLKMKISPTTYVNSTLLKSYLVDTIQKLDTPEGFWNYLMKTGYAFEDEAGAQTGTTAFALWKNNDQVLFAPRNNGTLIKTVQPIAIPKDKTLAIALNELLGGENTAYNASFVECLKTMGVIVRGESEARSALRLQPLGSYVLWTEADQWFILQKLECYDQITQAAKQIPSNRNLWAEICELTSEAAQLEWLNSHLSPNNDDLLAFSNGNFTITLHPPLITSMQAFYLFAQKPIYGNQFNTNFETIVPATAWKQINDLISPFAQFTKLELYSDFVVKDREEAEKHLAEKKNPLCIWRLADGQIGVLTKTKNFSTISFDQNLYKEIIKVTLTL